MDLYLLTLKWKTSWPEFQEIEMLFETSHLFFPFEGVWEAERKRKKIINREKAIYILSYSLVRNFFHIRENILLVHSGPVHMGQLLQVSEGLCCNIISPVAWHGALIDRPGKPVTEAGEKAEAFNVLFNSLFIRGIRCEGAWNSSQFWWK